MVHSNSIDDLCIWNKVMHDPKSTTAADVHGPDHPLYKCIACKKPYGDGNCDDYRSMSLWRLRKYERLMSEIEELKEKMFGSRSSNIRKYDEGEDVHLFI